MKVVHFQASSGLSGDMILASLLDLDLNHDDFKKAIKNLGLEVRLKISEVRRASLRAKRVEVLLPKGKQIKERNWTDIEFLIKNSNFSSWVKENSLRIFMSLFEAESKVHGLPVDKIHLHEIGADDALVDIIGSCWLLEKLKVENISCSPINLGSGWVKTSHGLLPVPPPAVSELLKNKPVFSSWAETELTTPTGAAIISTLASAFISFPQIIVNRIGYGAGEHNFPHFPNILRAFLGEEFSPPKTQPIYEIRANIDDSTPQVLAYACERAFEAGALDVFQTPLVMKKGRLGTQLTVLTEADKIDKIIDILFRETTTIGLRYHPVERWVLERRIEKVEIEGVEVPVKVTSFGDEEIQVQPELEACRQIARQKGLSLRQIQQMAIDSWRKKRERLQK